ncbi:hypothetical protein [Microcoleus sp. AT9b-C3]|uniref:hypothetical protein n=1 Tax=Microcoleus sp. AT9b-C3 TaxID=2818629 RepID=UPI002FD09ABC
MNFITFLQNINSNILSSIAIFFNLVLFVRLIVGCGRGIRQGWTICEATTGKITELGLYTAILFGAWQWWPHEASGVNCISSMCVCGVCWGISRLHFQVGFRASCCPQLIT